MFSAFKFCYAVQHNFHELYFPHALGMKYSTTKICYALRDYEPLAGLAAYSLCIDTLITQTLQSHSEMKAWTNTG